MNENTSHPKPADSSPQTGGRAPYEAPTLKVIGTVEHATLGSTNATFDGGGLFS